MRGRHAAGTQPQEIYEVDRLWDKYNWLKDIPAPTEAFFALSDALDAEEADRVARHGRIRVLAARIRSIFREEDRWTF